MNGIKWGKVEGCAENVIIIGSGPSVRDIKLDRLQGLRDTYIVSVNGAGSFVPFADAWFTLDPWGLHGPQLPVNSSSKLYAAVPADYGTPYARSLDHRVVPVPAITFLHRLASHNYTNISSDTAYSLELSEDRSCIHTGNSGFGALNLAYHLRPKNIYLLGIDGSIGYFYPSKTNNRPLKTLQILFESAKTQLDDANINVFNVSMGSLVQSYKKLPSDDFHAILDKLN